MSEAVQVGAAEVEVGDGVVAARTGRARNRAIDAQKGVVCMVANVWMVTNVVCSERDDGREQVLLVVG